MVKQYFINWLLYWRGYRWLWTRELSHLEEFMGAEGYRLRGGGWIPAGTEDYFAIRYRPGWTPLRFLPVYCTTYLLGTLIGAGVVSLSQFWYERSKLMRTLAGMEHPGEDEDCRALGCRPANPFSRFMTRLLNLALPGKVHGALTGPRLWGSEDLWL